MPSNNDNINRAEGRDVITAKVKYPQQGIQAQLDKVYLYNPDAAGINAKHDDTLKGVGTQGDPLGIAQSVLDDIDSRVEKTTEINKVYGTNEYGNQVTYDLSEFGAIEDVRVNGTSVVVDKIAEIDPVASDVAYTNSQYPSIQNLQDAMDELLYLEPAVTITGGGTYEIGSVRASTVLNWSWNKTIVSQSLNQGIGTVAPNARTYTYASPISENTTFTITGTDGKKSKSASTNVTFMPKRYWGVSTKTSLTDEEIIALSSELSTSRTQTRTFNCSGGKYFYFAIKTSYCSGIQFKVGGLSFTDMIVTTRPFTNASGHTDTYNIYRVNNIQTGSAILVEVL